MVSIRWESTVEHHSPPFSRRGGRAIKTLERSAGVVIKESPISCLNLLTTPSAPLRNGIFLLRAQPPLLGKEGNGHAGCK